MYLWSLEQQNSGLCFSEPSWNRIPITTDVLTNLESCASCDNVSCMSWFQLETVNKYLKDHQAKSIVHTWVI